MPTYDVLHSRLLRISAATLAPPVLIATNPFTLLLLLFQNSTFGIRRLLVIVHLLSAAIYFCGLRTLPFSSASVRSQPRLDVEISSERTMPV